MANEGFLSRASMKFREGKKLAEEGKLEEAYKAFSISADCGNPKAMWAIAKLYLYRDFRKVKVTNLGELLFSGRPIFPWSLEIREEIDYRTALMWCLKAADNGHAAAALAAGAFLCSGCGHIRDMERGLQLIKKAVNADVPGAAESYEDFLKLRKEGTDSPETK